MNRSQTQSLTEPNDYITIEHNTKLIDVLAEEFEEKGINSSHDINGFQNISGLQFKNKRPDRKNNDVNRADFRGTLSSFKNITIVPGVSLKEQKDLKKEPRHESDYVKVTGGAFRAPLKDQSTTSGLSHRMSMHEYGKLGGTRSYFPSTEREIQRKSTTASVRLGSGHKSVRQSQDDHVRVINMNVS